MKNQNRSNNHTRNLTVIAVLFAVIMILTYMPMRLGPIEMTLRMIPVVLGGILLGPVAGAVLGGFFGLTSFFECYGILGMPQSAFGSFMVGLDPVLTAVMCFVPRILMGLLAALIYKGLKKLNDNVALAVTNLSGAILNTVFFVSALILLFWKNPAFIEGISSAPFNMDASTLFPFIIAFVGINALIEALVCGIIGTPVCKGVKQAVKLDVKQ